MNADRFDGTGIPHLDTILGGGLPRGALVLVMGTPGSGKTTLASQIAFTLARAGKRALILTALSESTGKLIEHLTSFTFFDQTLVGEQVRLLSLQTTLAQGLDAAKSLIVDEVRRMQAQLVVVDGFRGMRSVDTEPQAAREFLYGIGSVLGTLGVTTIITSETDPRDPSFFPETTTADVIVGLHGQLNGVRQYRGIEIIKARGVAPLSGLHALVVSEDGMSVYPQLESRVARQTLREERAEPTTGEMSAPSRATFGLAELDQMLAGGIPRATCTLLAGSLGTGKTLLSLNYALAGVRAREQVLFLGFRESKAQLLQAAEPFVIGEEFATALAPHGGITFLEVPPIMVDPDVLADQLLTQIDRTGAQRLIIDSIAELERGIVRSLDPQRLEDYLAALLLSLRSRRVTALLLKESDKAIAATLDFSSDALSVLAENVLLVQQVPYQGTLHRILSIPKLRFSDHDTNLREFRIHAPEGMHILEPSESEAGVLAGITQDQERAVTRRSRREARDSSPE